MPSESYWYKTNYDIPDSQHLKTHSSERYSPQWSHRLNPAYTLSSENDEDYVSEPAVSTFSHYESIDPDQGSSGVVLSAESDPWSLDEFVQGMDMNLNDIFAKLDDPSYSIDHHESNVSTAPETQSNAQTSNIEIDSLESIRRRIGPIRKRRRQRKDVPLEEVAKTLLPCWKMLPERINKDPIALAEVVEDWGVDHVAPNVINSIMANLLTDNGYTRNFVEDFEARRHVIYRTGIHIGVMEKNQARMTQGTKKITMNAIDMMLKKGIKLDGPVIELERSTRDLHSGGVGHYFNATWYSAIMYYLIQKGKKKEAGLFRRLRADYENEVKKRKQQ